MPKDAPAPGAPLEFVRSDDTGGADVHFLSGARVRVLKGRARSYPGLQGPNPETLSVYRSLKGALEETDVVWDLGSGSGAGCAELAGVCQVIGIECDDEPLIFARHYAPNVRFVKPSEVSQSELPEPSVVSIVDVLAQCPLPEALLFSLRSRTSQARLFCAEARAFAGQSLLVPARRAFSQKSLARTLVRGGFLVEELLSEDTLVSCVARPLPPPVAEAFAAARAAAAQQLWLEALAHLDPLRSHDLAEVRAEASVLGAEWCVQLAQGDASSARFLEALEDVPDHAPALAGLSQLLMAAGDMRQGVELAGRAFDLEPSSIEAACAMAIALEHAAPESALKSWQHALNLEPADADVVTAFAEAADRGGQSGRAADAMKQLQRYGEKTTADFHVTLALLLIRAGRQEEAEIELRMVGALDRKHPALPELQAALAAA